MNIYIDGKKVEVEIQEEKTIGELLQSLTTFLNGFKQLVSQVTVDGEIVSEEKEAQPIPSCSQIEIETFLYLDFILLNCQKALSALQQKNWEQLDSLLKELTESPALAELLKPYQRWKEALPSPSVAEGKPLESLLLSIQSDLENCFSKWEEMRAFIQDFLETQKEAIPVLLQTGKAQFAINQIANLADYLTFLNRVTPLIVPLADEVKIEEQIASIQPILAQIITAIEEDDKVLLGDLIEYELSAPLENFYNFLESISNKG